MARLVALAVLALTVPPAVAAGRDVLVEAGFDAAEGDVHAQALYRLRVYQAVDVSDLHIVPPAAPQAEVRPLEGARVDETFREGRRYRVREYRYAVFPLVSGTLELGGAGVAGRVPSASARTPDGRRPLRLIAPVARLTVRPIPALIPHRIWLPANRISLAEDWSPPSVPILGEPMRQVVRVEAVGVLAERIPELRVVVPGLSVHPGPARLSNRQEGDSMIGSREQVFDLVPRRAGAVPVPTLTLPWWDATRGRMEEAALPGRVLDVSAPSPREDRTALPGTGKTGVAASSSPQETDAGAAGWSLASRFVSPYTGTLAALLGAAWGLALLAVVARRYRAGAAWRLWRACRRGDGAGARDVLIDSAAAIWPGDPPRTLAALAERLDAPARREAVRRLERRLYGPVREQGPLAGELVALVSVILCPGRA